MSDVILTWLNDKVLLSKRITSLTDDFSNGYLFGELIHKYKCIDNFDKYINSPYIEDKETNFNMLTASLYSLNFDISDELIKGLISADKKSICLFLYKLKSYFDRKESNFNEIILKTARYKISLKSIMPSLRKSKILNNKGIDSLKVLKSNSLPKPIVLNREMNQKKYSDNNNLSTIPQQITKPNEDNNELLNNNPFKNSICSPIEGNDKGNNQIVREETINDKITNNLHSSNLTRNIFLKEDNGLFYKLSNRYNKRGGKSNTNINNLSLVKMAKMNNKIAKNCSFHAEVFINQMTRLGLQLNDLEINKMKHKSSEDVESFAQKLIMNKLHKKYTDALPFRKENEISHKRMLSNQFVLNPPLSIKENLSKSVSSLNQHNIRTQFETKRLGEIKRQKKVERDEKFHFKLLKHIANYKNCIPVEEEKEFNKSSYFSILDKEHRSIIQEKIAVNENKMRRDYSYMSMVFDQIFDFAYEAVIYQTERSEDYVPVDKWREWNNCFVTGTLLRLPAETDETKQLKQVVVHGKEEDDYSKDGFDSEVECNCQDYLHYFGRWNITLPNKMKTVDFKIQEIYTNAFFTNGYSRESFEPTEDEKSNLILPKNNVKNYFFGDMISSIIDSKFQLNKDMIKRSSNSIGKYSDLSVKLCFIGYPCSGRKTLAKRIQEEYFNVKIYIMSNIIKNTIKEYRRINMPIEDNPKYKSMKKAQIDQLIIERDKEIKDFKEVSDILSSYVNTLDKDPSSEPSDNLLFQIFKYQLEKDFDNPKTSDQSERNENLISMLKKKQDLQIQLENLKQENAKSKKPKIKEEEILQKEIDRLSNEAFKGFILIDYPKTLSQFQQIENYFTDYVPEMNKPKTEKSILIDKLSSIIDISLHQPSINHYTQGGFDYIIDFQVNLKEITRRYQGLRYDQVTGQVYHLDDNPPNDKKIKDRLMPLEDLSITQLNNQIKEYDSYQSSIKKFYQDFGNERLNTKAYQIINATLKEDELYSSFKSTILRYITKQIGEKEKEKEANELNSNNIDLITKDISPIGTLHANEQVTMSNKKTSRVNLKKLSIANISNNVITQTGINDNIINQITLFNDKYKLECLSFSKFILKQIDQIRNRIELMQRVFIQYLSTPTNKLNYINVYIKKYTSFITEYPNYINDSKVIYHFKDDIRLLIDKIWIVIQHKKQALIDEYNQINRNGFIDNEKRQLYKHMESIFITEASKYICFIDLIKQYFIKTDMHTDSLSSFVSPDDIKAFLASSNSSGNNSYENKIANLFKGCFFLIAKIDFVLKEVLYSKIIPTTFERTNTKRIKKVNCTLSDNKEGSFQDEIKTVVHYTKQQFKYRIMILRYFAVEQYNTITKEYNNVLERMDKWIIQSIRMQNDSMNQLSLVLSDSLDKGTIPYYDSIEHDKFNYETIDPSILFNCNKANNSIYKGCDDEQLDVQLNLFKSFIDEIRRYESVPCYIRSSDFMKIFLMKTESKKEQNALSHKFKAVTFKDLNNFISKVEECYLNNKDEYESYIEINKLLTFILLSNCIVPNRDNINEIIDNSKDKLINSTCLSKEDFLRLSFWFDSVLNKNEHAIKEVLFQINRIESEDIIDIYYLCHMFFYGKNTDTASKSNNKTNLTYYDVLFIDDSNKK